MALKEAREMYGPEIGKAEERLENKLSEECNFNNYSKSFVSVTPSQELNSLTSNSKLKFAEARRSAIGGSGWCC